jgi:CheY-specific phosphatase CheX
MAAVLTVDLLARVLGSTLEEAAFVFADSTDDAPPHEGPLVEARLAFTGAFDGELALVAPAALAATLAANLLGEDEGGAAATGDDEDAMGELLNMIAGVLAAELFGENGAFELGLPRVRRVGPEEQARAAAGALAVATLVEEDGRRIDLSVERARRAA